MMLEFKAISLRQIRAFSEILSKSTLAKKDFIKKRYLESAINFEEIIDFLFKLRLIKFNKTTITPKAGYNKLLRDLRDSKQSEQLITKFLVNNILIKQNYYSEYIDQFLANFTYADGQYEYSPFTADKLKYSNLRNFLIELGLLHLDTQEDKYIIDGDYLINYFQRRKSRHISLEEFTQIQQDRARIGFKAELKIIEYEKDRLSQYPILITQIEHTARLDISAGYDVKSFDYDKDEKYIPRFIEVKAVSPWDYRFYWTKNEIEASQLYKRNYYLYLLPIQAKNEFDLGELKIISDPYKNVYQNKDKWISASESISFALQKSEVNA